MSFPGSIATDEQLKIFHHIDRRFYKILTITLGRHPMDSMHCIALLIWLEKKGFRNLVHKCLFLSHQAINQLMDEAMACLSRVNTGFVSFSTMPGNVLDIPMLRNVTMEEITLGFFDENRKVANEGVTKAMNEICRKVLSDFFPMTFGLVPAPPVPYFTLVPVNNNVGLYTNIGLPQDMPSSSQQPMLAFGRFGQFFIDPNQMQHSSESPGQMNNR